MVYVEKNVKNLQQYDAAEHCTATINTVIETACAIVSVLGLKRKHKNKKERQTFLRSEFELQNLQRL
jgi:hypothetical protein